MNSNNINFEEEKFSESEQHGLTLLSNSDLMIFAPGVSTGGIAEMKMAKQNKNRKIIATTIDQKGARNAREMIKKYGFENKIEIKLEDVSKPLPYTSNYFDFVYARLVLHYLSKQCLNEALKEIYRVLKPGKKTFVVVRSTQCDETKNADSKLDKITMLTIFYYTNPQTGEKTAGKRYFHTTETITNHLKEAGFDILSAKSYQEQLYIDFERQVLSPQIDHLIEVVALKSSS